ncbi:MAG TPA: regulatory iron-sulfur-containing complex subunit RicT [Gemmatimonadaceae bacterium]
MPHLIEVRFKGNRKEFFLWEGDPPPPVKAPVVVEADRGEDLGWVHATGDLAELRARGCTHGPGGETVTRVARRIATAEDLKRLDEMRAQDEPARRRAMERVKANGLAMKLSDAEWRWDRRKLTFYFTAEKRVDFRALVRELATTFRTRIELKQIGVRDEARRLGGVGRCGREYCSASWLPELRPVNLAVAKDQRLSLNPSQISGACGRLMCCLRYEHEFYVQQRKRFPKEGKAIATSRGMEKVVANDIFRERVTLRGEDGETRVVPLIELRREMGVDRTIEMPATDEEAGPPPLEQLPEEVIRLQDTSELPAWIPRPSPPRGGRELPVASAEPPDESADDAAIITDGEATAATPGSASDNGDQPTGGGEREGRRRRRRRGRRGGRRNRGERPSGSSPESSPSNEDDG